MTDTNINTEPMSGFQELLPKEQMLFNWMRDVIREGFEMFGFIPLQTPIIERQEVLLAKAGGETERQIYTVNKLQKDVTEDIALRFDLTVPLARYVANNFHQLTFPYRRYAIGRVYRGERPQAGRFREFYQADIDIVGSGSLSNFYDGELVAVIYTVFKNLGLKEFTVRINNRRILNGLFEALNLGAASSDVMRVLDKLERIGEGGVKKKLAGLGVSSEGTSQLMQFIKISGSVDDTIDALEKLEISNDAFNRGLKELSEVVGIIGTLGVPEEYFTVDLTIARGLDYYTGTVYETFLDNYPDVGSVCSGGRYDDLAGYYTDRNLPGVGISIGLTRLFDQLLKRGVLQLGSATPTRVLVINIGDGETLKAALELALKLRANKIPTEIYFEQGDIRQRLDYANNLEIPFVVFIGEDEIAKRLYTLKDFRTGTQQELSFGDLLSVVCD